MTFLPEAALVESGADYVIRGEGETACPALLRELERGGEVGDTPGVCRRQDGGCQARVDMVAARPDLVRRMASAGCGSMTIGIESGIAEILDSYNKKITVEQVHEAVRVTASTGIVDFWYFMFGSGDQYDTEDYWRANAEFLFALDRDLVNVSLLTPYPGTDLYERLSAEGRIVDTRWQNWDAAHCVYKPMHATPQALQRIYTETVRRYYLSRSPLRNLKAILRARQSGRYSIPSLLRFLLLVAQEAARQARQTAASGLAERR